MKHLIVVFAFIIAGYSSIFAQESQGKYFVMLNINPSRKELPKAEAEKVQAAHSANIDSLSKAGTLLAAGPFNGGGGFFVLVATSPDEAQTIVNTDPAVKADRFIVELYPLVMNYGSICPVKGNIEMIDFQFIKYNPVKDAILKANAGKLEKLAKKHLRFLKETGFPVKYIAEGDFGAANGGFLVIEKAAEEKMKNLLKNDPWAKSGYFTADLKILWMAKGSFCETERKK